MTVAMGISLVVLLLVIAGLKLTATSPDMVLLGGLVVLVVTGTVAPADALGGFSNEGLATIAAVRGGRPGPGSSPEKTRDHRFWQPGSRRPGRGARAPSVRTTFIRKYMICKAASSTQLLDPNRLAGRHASSSVHPEFTANAY